MHNSDLDAGNTNRRAALQVSVWPQCLPDSCGSLNRSMPPRKRTSGVLALYGYEETQLPLEPPELIRWVSSGWTA